MRTVLSASAILIVVLTVVSAVGLTLAQRGPNIAAGTYQCGVFSKSYGFGTWLYLSNTSWTTILSLSLPNVPISAYYHVVCDGHATVLNAMAEVAIGVDTTAEDTSTRRFYSYTDIGWNMVGIHTERVYHLAAGSHTFNFLGTILNGPVSYGYVSVNYHTITVTVFTDGSTATSTTAPSTSISADGR